MLSAFAGLQRYAVAAAPASPPRPPPVPRKRRRVKPLRKRTWRFANGRRTQIRSSRRLHTVYHCAPRSTRWVRGHSYRDFKAAQRAAARER